MSEDLLVHGMRGLLGNQEMLWMTAMLEADADAGEIAASVPDDEFLRKVREHLQFQMKADSEKVILEGTQSLEEGRFERLKLPIGSFQRD